jgi:hypothetical protein
MLNLSRLHLQTLANLESLAKGKHSSLFRKSVNYVRKKFYNIGHRARNLKRFKAAINSVSK